MQLFFIAIVIIIIVTVFKSILIKLKQNLNDEEKPEPMVLGNTNPINEKFNPRWPTDGKTVSSGWGMRIHPTDKIKKHHNGIDITASGGLNIYAPESGVVAAGGLDKTSGNWLRITHSNGYTTSYAHLAKALVKTGNKVTKGQLIAIMGTTGKSTGIHLHFVIRKDGKDINPLTILPK